MISELLKKFFPSVEKSPLIEENVPTFQCSFCGNAKKMTDGIPTIWTDGTLQAKELNLPTCYDCSEEHCDFNEDTGDYQLKEGHEPSHRILDSR